MKEWLRRRWAVIWRLVGGVSLRVKIMGIALAMIVLLGLGLTWQVRVTMARALTEELEQRGISIARHMATHSTNLILTGDLHSFDELVQDIVLNDEDIQYAFILDAYGEVLAQSFDGDIPTDLLGANRVYADQRYHLQTIKTEEGLIQDVAVPIFEGHFGVVRVGLSQHRLSYTLVSVTRQILLTTLLVSLLGVVISMALTWVFTQPLLALAKATRRVVEEDLSYRLTPWADDEVGQLQASFNTMIEHLARSHQEMEDYNRRLLRRNRELSALYAILSTVVGPQGLTEVLERALQQVIDMAHATDGWVCILDNDSSCKVCAHAREGSWSYADSTCRDRCLICQKAAHTRQPIVINTFPAECPLCATQDPNGCPVTGHIIVPLLVKEQTVGFLNLTRKGKDCVAFDAEDLDPLAAVGQQLGIAIENVRLWEELCRKEALRGKLLHKVITAQEDERKRIARELHDEAGQALTSLLIGLRAMAKSSSLREVHALTSDLKQVVAHTLDAVHDLAVELRPSVLDDLGLVPALTHYAQSCPARFGFHVDFVTSGMDGQRLPPEVETTLYRITQEALTNVARHADASQVSVLLQRRREAVILVIEDDGEGFDVAQMMASPEKQNRLGLYGVEERASLVNGRMTVESRPGAGTTISIEIPLENTWSVTERAKQLTGNRPSAS